MYNDRSDLVEGSHSLQVYGVNSAEGEDQRPGRQRLTEMEQLQLAAWKATRRNYPRKTCFSELVARRLPHLYL